MLKRLLRLEALRRPMGLVVLGLLGLLGTASLLTAWALVEHLGDLARYAVTGSADERTLRVIPAQPSAASQAVDWEKRPLDQADLAFLAGLDGVVDVRPVYNVPVPTTLGLSLPPIIDTHQYLALYAMRTEAVPAEVQEAWAATEGPMPLLANPQIITMFNLGLADRYHMPRLSPEILQRIELKLQLGYDPYIDLKKYHFADARFAGFAADVPTWGAAVPLHRVEPIYRELLGDGAPPLKLVRCAVVLADTASLEAAHAAIAERGLAMDGSTELAAAVTRAQRTVRRLLLGLLLGLGLLAVCSIAALTAAVVAERRRQLRRCILAGGRWYHACLIFGTGMLGSLLLGLLLGWAAARLLVPVLATRFAAVLLGDAMSLDDLSVDPATLSWTSLPLCLAIGLGIGLAAIVPVVLAAERHLLRTGLRHG